MENNHPYNHCTLKPIKKRRVDTKRLHRKALSYISILNNKWNVDIRLTLIN